MQFGPTRLARRLEGLGALTIIDLAIVLKQLAHRFYLMDLLVFYVFTLQISIHNLLIRQNMRRAQGRSLALNAARHQMASLVAFIVMFALCLLYRFFLLHPAVKRFIARLTSSLILCLARRIKIVERQNLRGFTCILDRRLDLFQRGCIKNTATDITLQVSLHLLLHTLTSAALAIFSLPRHLTTIGGQPAQRVFVLTSLVLLL